ncbi:MAG: zinc transporter ZupT [Crocinitomicaceae bacterium]|nr:zinc transporter ZupT [Crocinitomicaceae bacterium]
MDQSVLYAFALTLFAGLSTGIGSAIGLFSKKTNYKVLSLAMGFSAGVMIYISFVELFMTGRESLVHALGTKLGNWTVVGSFFAGIALIAVIDKLVPHEENPHEFDHTEDLKIAEKTMQKQHPSKLLRTGLVTALAIAIHNFPEGMATFAGAMQDIKLGIPIAIAIAIHNIPEGLAVSVPIYYSTGDRKKAFLYSFLSGLAEPLGALIGYFLLHSFFTEAVMGVVFGAIAGIMVFISFDQLLPAAEQYGAHHISIYGLLAGMMVMAVSLLLFL